MAHHIAEFPLLLPGGSSVAEALLVSLRLIRGPCLPGEAGAALVLPPVPVFLPVEDSLN